MNTPPAGGNKAERNDFLFIQEEEEAEDKDEVMYGGRDTISACRFLVLKCTGPDLTRRCSTDTSQRILNFTQPKNIFRRLLFSGQTTDRKDGI